MNFSHTPPLASLEAARPVFLIVTGVFLAIIAWRIARTSGTWTARFLISGAFLLGLGYAVIIPGYEAGLIHRYLPGRQLGDPATALAWKAVTLAVMNGGWFVFGIGISMHAGIIRLPSLRRAPNPAETLPAKSQTIPARESAA